MALIDIIFCLCIFFMCSFHFKQLEGKMETWLPKHGNHDAPALPPSRIVLDDVRVIVDQDPSLGLTRRLGARPVESDPELRALLRETVAEAESLGKRVTITIDGTARAPWRSVLRVLDLCELEFPTPPEERRKLGERRRVDVELTQPLLVGSAAR